ncbi:hypothetical protein DQ04_02891020 [Trypanosoma grayi]|uniref:hypothetical protein n=1 Tax=Trypanosoma grayi TaxID=71804 RepID=UPI0004F40AC9|nr:hypothetical protein DQ04_02891020 [Trypanosoma grayi]KEG11177.1 hypothetical protein DQ04_02891020 [Trypanosoma grayi]
MPVAGGGAGRHDRGPKSDTNADTDYGTVSGGTQLPLLRERSRRRLVCDGEEEVRKVASFKFVTITPFLDVKPVRSTESDTITPSLASTQHRAVTVLPGSFDTNIMDQIRRKFGGVMFPRQNNDKLQHCTVRNSAPPQEITLAVGDGSGKPSLLHTPLIAPGRTTETDGNYQATPWILQEVPGGVLRCQREGIPSYQRLETLCGETIMFTLPCDMVGTHHLMTALTDLFGPFAVRVPGDSLYGNTSGGDKVHAGAETFVDDDAQRIRQLISDVTFYILTFSDAVLTRAEGALSLDEQLMGRPPPMVSSLTELVALFQKEMYQRYGVHVAPWQIIPYSGTMSHATRDALTAIFEARLARQGLVDTEDIVLSMSSADTQLFPLNTSCTSLLLPQSTTCSSGSCIHTAINTYCSVVYGQHFNTQKHTISAEQLEDIVWHYALNTTWEESGACQLLHTVKCFEGSAVQHYLSFAALCIAMWCRQMRMMLPQMRKILRGQKKRLRGELRVKREQRNAMMSALKQLKEEAIPRVMSQSIQFQLQERFEGLTVMFWWSLIDLLNEENKCIYKGQQNVKRFPPFSTCHVAPLLSSSQSVQARERLGQQYRIFMEFYVVQNYQRQMSQLRRIIAEEKRKADGSSTRLGVSTRSEVLTPSSSASVPSTFSLEEATRHHIPFVAQHALELKATMEKELTLQLARFNTEVINYFMAELAVAMLDIVTLCEQQRKEAKKKMMGVVRSIDYLNGYELAERKMLRSTLREFSRLGLAHLPPPRRLESFVTGLRSALCEDQILLIVKHLEEDEERQQAMCAPRTTAYLAKAERENHDRLLRPTEVVHPLNARLLQQMRLHEGLFWAPVEIEDVTPLPEKWMRKSTSVGMEEGNSKAAAPLRGLTGCADDLPQRQWCWDLDDDEAPTNPLWFILRVWQEVLSVMSFRPWVVLHSVRYATLLNNICLIFLKGHARLDKVLNDDTRDLESALCRARKEAYRLEVDVPDALQRLSSTAATVAHDLKSADGENIMGAGMYSTKTDI